MRQLARRGFLKLAALAPAAAPFINRSLLTNSGNEPALARPILTVNRLPSASKILTPEVIAREALAQLEANVAALEKDRA